MSKNHDLRQLSVDETISGSAIFILFRDSKKAVCISLPFHFSYVHKSSTTLFFLRFLLVFLFLLFLHQSLRLFYLTTVPQAFRCNDISIQFEPHLRCWGWLLMVYRMCTCPAPSRSLSLSLSSPSVHPHPHLDGWHVAHYVICPLDQSTCSAHFFPAS